MTVAVDVAERMVKRVDPHGSVSAIFRNAHLRQAVPTVRQVRVVDLEQKPASTIASYSSRMASAMANTNASSLP